MSRRVWITTAATALLAFSHCFAQPASQFIGDWKVTYPGRTRPIEARLSITASGGHWQTMTVDVVNANPCTGRKYEVAFEPIGNDEARITMLGAQALAGCPSFTVTMKLTNERSATGTRGSAPLKFTRLND